jgi:signal transduction histidine kinase
MLRSVIGKSKILIIDDEQANVRLLERILELMGATRIESTTDSRQAMALFLEFRPDLVLLDLHMPNVTGFDIMEQIKALCAGENHQTPVLVLTADVTAKTKHRALAAGAKDFLTKPLDQSEVLLRIRNLLEHRFLHIQLQNQNILLEEQVHERTAQLEDTLDRLRLAQHAALKQERLSAFGTMAAGIAHDFNNSLTLILGYTDLMLSGSKSASDKKQPDYIRAITTAATDAAQVVRRLREFHRPDDGTETRVALQLNQIVEQAVTMTRPKWKDHAAGRGVEISVETQLGILRPISGDPAEVREMLTNLIFNAVDAMPAGGLINVKTAMEDGQISLRVQDSGTGMDEETRRRCLEPFFTTKGEKGTGLGLAAVYGIVERHHGTVDVESELGCGTTFCIQLPAVEGEAAEQDANSDGAAEERGRILKILVVDDQPIICEVIQEQLRSDGHQVDAAGNGEEALESIRASCYDLLVTDQSMPGMSGEELAPAAKEICPKLAVILLTGFGGSATTNDLKPGIDMMLGKPATLTELRRAIMQVTG